MYEVLSSHFFDVLEKALVRYLVDIHFSPQNLKPLIFIRAGNGGFAGKKKEKFTAHNSGAKVMANSTTHRSRLKTQDVVT